MKYADRLRRPGAWWALAGVTAGAAALRLPFLGTQSLTYDETFTRAIVIQSGSPGDVWRGVEATEATPPLHYLVSWAFSELAGTASDAALRAPAALAGVAGAPVAFFALRRLVGERIALAAAAMFAASPVLVWYALDARAYSLLVLTALLSVWALAVLLTAPSRRAWLGWALACAAALWSHYFAVFLVGAEAAVLLWRLPSARWTALAAGAGLTVLVLPLLPLLATQGDERSSGIADLDLGERVEQSVRQFTAGPNVPSALLEGGALALAAGGLFAGLALVPRRRESYLPLAVLAAVGLCVPLVLALSGIDDHFFMRNLLGVWICVAALSAAGLSRLHRVPLAAYLVLCVVIVLAVQTQWQYQNADWEGAAETLGERAGAAPLIVFPNFNGRVAAPYLDATEVPGGVVAAEAWALVEPERIDRRDLRPLDDYPKRPPPGFSEREVLRHHGFRIVRYTAPRPLPIQRDSLGRDVLGDLPALLVRDP